MTLVTLRTYLSGPPTARWRRRTRGPTRRAPPALLRDPSSESSSGSAEPTPSPTAGVTLRPGQTLVAQGSKEADALVHAFVDEPGKRTEIDAVILPERRETSPQFIMRL
jgi:hypothetical protein